MKACSAILNSTLWFYLTIHGLRRRTYDGNTSIRTQMRGRPSLPVEGIIGNGPTCSSYLLLCACTSDTPGNGVDTVCICVHRHRPILFIHSSSSEQTVCTTVPEATASHHTARQLNPRKTSHDLKLVSQMQTLAPGSSIHISYYCII